jgi:hypothetical protein
MRPSMPNEIAKCTGELLLPHCKIVLLSMFDVLLGGPSFAIAQDKAIAARGI